MKRQEGSLGFTLIELLIVVLIIAILAAIAVPNFLEFQTRAKVSRCKADMRTVVIALEAYCVDNNDYPIDHGWDPGVDLIVLSTPVSYVSTIPLDPFTPLLPPIPNPPLNVELGQQFSFDFGRPSDAWNDDTLLSLYEDASIYWYMFSPGPNKKYEAFFWYPTSSTVAGRPYPYGHELVSSLPGGAGVDILYDPTNGTISDGDLICISKGGLIN